MKASGLALIVISGAIIASGGSIPTTKEGMLLATLVTVGSILFCSKK